MMHRHIAAFLLCLLPAARAQQRDPQLEAELKRIDALAADPETKPLVVAAIADRLQVHRNRVMLLRRDTSQSFSAIFATRREAAGAGSEQILREARELVREVESRRGVTPTQAGTETEEPRVSPILYLSAGIDYNAVGTFYSTVPEIGIQAGPASFVVGIPYYRNTATGFSATGVGDVYATGALFGNAGPVELGAAVAVGVPTGDQTRGLGAGKTTVDGVATVARRFANARAYFNAGLANSVFSNVVYQRPYVADGNAAYFSGGLEARVVPRLVVGAGGFSVRPFGTQVVFSRTVEPVATPAPGAPAAPSPTMPNPRSRGRANPPAPGQKPTPVFETDTNVEAAPEELRDHGINGWASVMLHPGVYLNLSVARSIPFELTAVRFGLGFDLARLLFHRPR